MQRTFFYFTCDNIGTTNNQVIVLFAASCEEGKPFSDTAISSSGPVIVMYGIVTALSYYIQNKYC